MFVAALRVLIPRRAELAALHHALNGEANGRGDVARGGPAPQRCVAPRARAPDLPSASRGRRPRLSALWCAQQGQRARLLLLLRGERTTPTTRTIQHGRLIATPPRAQACDFFMCTACAMSGSCRVLTPKHRCPLLQTWHDELWHCNVCHRDQEFRPVAASALPATAAAASLPTAKPAVVAQMATGSSEAHAPLPLP